jgi:hypothetical protein
VNHESSNPPCTPCTLHANSRGGGRRRTQLSADPDVGLYTARPRRIVQERVVEESVARRVRWLRVAKGSKVLLRVGEGKGRNRWCGRHDGNDRVEAGEGRRCQQGSGCSSVEGCHARGPRCGTHGAMGDRWRARATWVLYVQRCSQGAQTKVHTRATHVNTSHIDCVNMLSSVPQH